jgi:hypothetical protein
VLRQHCEAVGRDYDQIEKTTMIVMDPAATAGELVRAAAGMRDLGFTAAYVYARDITEPGKIIDVLAATKAELG